jgi:hypothetical protein
LLVYVPPFPYAFCQGESAAPFSFLKGGGNMSRFFRMIKRIAVFFMSQRITAANCETSSGWKEMERQAALDYWLRNNGMK